MDEDKPIFKSNDYIAVIFVFFLSLVIYHIYFTNINSIFTWGDWGYAHRETLRGYLSFPSAWLGEFQFGVFDIGLSQYVFTKLSLGLLSSFFHPSAVYKIVFFWPSILISSVSAYLFVKNITRSVIGAVVGSVVYNFNTYSILLRTGHFTLASAFSLIPIAIILFQRMFETRNKSYLILFSLISSLVGYYDFRGLILLVFILILHSLYYSFVKKDFLYRYAYAFLSMFFIFLLNLFWLIPSFVSFSSFTGIAIGRQLFGDGHNIIQRVFTLFSPWWTGTRELVWGNPQTIFPYFWIIPFLALLGLWVNRKNKDIFFWGVISLIGIFLTKFTGEPFKNAYEWMFYNIPGFGAFRESSKFNIYVILGYSVLIGGFVNWFNKLNIQSYKKLLVLCFVLIVFLSNAIPVFRGEIGRLLTPRKIPHEYEVFNNYIKEQSGFFRTLYIPNWSRWGYWDSVRPRLGMADLISTNWNKLNNYNKTGLEFSSFEALTGLLKRDISQDLLNHSSIRFIVVPIEDKENEEMFIFPLDTNRQMFVDYLSSLNFLKKLDLGLNELEIYENTKFKPHLFINNQSNVRIEDVSLSQHNIEFLSEATNSTLHFSDNFDVGWKLRKGKFDWWMVFFDRNYFLPKENHIKSDFGLNEFNMNNDSNDKYYTLYFEPQAWLNVGVIISASTLLILLVILFLNTKDN